MGLLFYCSYRMYQPRPQPLQQHYSSGRHTHTHNIYLAKSTFKTLKLGNYFSKYSNSNILDGMTCRLAINNDVSTILRLLHTYTHTQFGVHLAMNVTRHKTRSYRSTAVKISIFKTLLGNNKRTQFKIKDYDEMNIIPCKHSSTK